MVVVGYLNLDLVVRVPAVPSTGQRVHATAVERNQGGMAANAAAAAQTFGAEVAFVGAVGDDADGAALVQGLADLGVDVDAVRTDAWTSTAVVLVDDDGQRSIVSQDDAVNSDDLRRAVGLAGNGDVLYVDGYRWPWAVQELQTRSADVHLVVDLDGVSDADAVEEAVRVADHVLCSHEHLGELIGGDDPRTLAADLAAKHTTTIVLTAGRDGWWRTDGHTTEAGSGLAVQAIDSTGAGDVFAGVYAACVDERRSPTETIRWANAAAALSTTARGARGCLPDRTATTELLRRPEGLSDTDPLNVGSLEKGTS